MMMKKETLGWGLFLSGMSLALTLILPACTAKSVPTSPAPTDTATNTPLSATNTATITPTATNTYTNTSVITSTATNSATRTVSSTATGTSTPSGTSTNTATATLTKTSTNSPTATVTPTITLTPIALAPGAVAFTAFIYNGNSEFAFVAPGGLANNDVIYFTNESYDGSTGGLKVFATPDPSGVSGQGVSEGILSYSAPATGLGAFVPVVIAKNSNDNDLLQGGTLTNYTNSTYGTGTGANSFLLLNHNGSGHKILAFTVNGAGVTTYLAALIFGPDTWQTSGAVTNYWDSYLPPGLTGGTNATDLSGLWATDSLQGDQAPGNQNAVLNLCQTTLPGMNNASNWAADGNVPKGSLSLDGGISGSAETVPFTVCVSAAGWTGTIPASVPTATFTTSPTFTSSPTAGNTATNSPTGTLVATSTPTNTSTPLPLGPGSIAFTALLQNGCSEFDFVATSGLSGGTTIYFTNGSYEATASGVVTTIGPDTLVSGNGVTEGVIAYVAPPGGLAAFAPVAVSKLSNDGDNLQGGSLVDISLAPGDTASSGVSTEPFLIFNHNGEGNKVIAYSTTGANSTGVTTYLAALIVGPDTWQTSGPVTNYWDSYLPTGLTSGTNALDLSGLWASNNLESLYVQGNDNAVLNSCQNNLSGVINSSNWAVDANVGAGTLFLVNSGSPLSACSSGKAGWTGTIPPTAYLATSTATNSPTLPPTATDTAVATSTATTTPTNTTTSTSTRTATGTVTPTPTNNGGLVITTSYTGAIFQSGKSVYDVQVSTDPSFVNAPVTTAQVGTTFASLGVVAPASVTLSLPAGTYYVGADWNVTGAGQAFPIPKNNPVVAAPCAMFNGILNENYNSAITYAWADSAANQATAVNLTTSGASIGITFGDTYSDVGFSGQPQASLTSGGATLALSSTDSVTISGTQYYFWAQVFMQDPRVYGTGPSNQTPANDWGSYTTGNMNVSCLKDLNKSSSVYVLLYLDPNQATGLSNEPFQPIQVGDPYAVIGPSAPQTLNVTKQSAGALLGNGVTVVASNTWAGFTPTFTPTATVTGTPTLCPTQAPTSTPVNNGESFSGAVSFTPGGVSASTPLGVLLVKASGSGGGSPSFTFLTSNGAPYTIDGQNGANTYYTVFWYNAFGDGVTYGVPHVGDPAYAYGSGGNCSISAWTALPPSQTGIGVTFDGTNTAAGLSGTVTYTGTLGAVDGCRQLIVQMWPSGTALTGASGSVTCSTCVPLDENSYSTNGAHIDMIPFGAAGFAGPCSTGTVAVLAFYSAGSSGTIQPGDPYVWMPGFTTSGVANNVSTVTISDSQTY